MATYLISYDAVAPGAQDTHRLVLRLKDMGAIQIFPSQWVFEHRENAREILALEFSSLLDLSSYSIFIVEVVTHNFVWNRLTTSDENLGKIFRP